MEKQTDKVHNVERICLICLDIVEERDNRKDYQIMHWKWSKRQVPLMPEIQIFVLICIVD